MKPRRIQMTIDSNLSDSSLIGDAVNGICKKRNITGETLYHLELCVVEAVNNSIKHAYRNEDGNEVDVMMEIYEDRIEFQIKDRGIGMVKRPSGRLDFDENDIMSLPESGMGLYIMDRVMDKVSYTSDGGVNILRLVKFISSGTSAA